MAFEGDVFINMSWIDGPLSIPLKGAGKDLDEMDTDTKLKDVVIKLLEKRNVDDWAEFFEKKVDSDAVERIIIEVDGTYLGMGSDPDDTLAKFKSDFRFEKKYGNPKEDNNAKTFKDFEVNIRIE
jgi:hypothetical protein